MAEIKPLTISVIIPVEPGGSVDKALGALAEIDYSHEKIEIIVAEGRQPSRQRNEAAKQASGEILYFLDNDSEADIDLFRFVVRSFSDERVAAVGGPSEILRSDSFLQKCFGYALGSYFGATSGRCRFRSIGRSERLAEENELILCNMGVRRDLFIEMGGFDERLYPNEENEFLNRVTARGYKLIHNPRAVVWRPHRTTFAKFVRQMFNYGRGRMEHFLLRPSFFSPLYMIPLVFVLYILSLIVFHPWWYLLPVLLYAVADGMSTMRIVIDEEDVRVAAIVPFLFPTIHFAYAAGMTWGLLKRGGAKVRRQASTSEIVVNIRRIKDFRTSETIAL